MYEIQISRVAIITDGILKVASDAAFARSLHGEDGS